MFRAAVEQDVRLNGSDQPTQGVAAAARAARALAPIADLPATRSMPDQQGRDRRDPGRHARSSSTWAPRSGLADAQRNCASNIGAQGLCAADAADKLVWLMAAARKLGASGVALKDESGDASSRVEVGSTQRDHSTAKSLDPQLWVSVRACPSVRRSTLRKWSRQLAADAGRSSGRCAWPPASRGPLPPPLARRMRTPRRSPAPLRHTAR